MKVSYLWLKEYLPDALPNQEELQDLITFHAFEIEGSQNVGDDTIINIDVLPNRSSDCLSHRGVAREISAIVGKKLIKDPLQKKLSSVQVANNLIISIENKKQCSRYSTMVIEGVAVGPSPLWLKSRLEALGQRSINNIVDATNYVMFNLGQPLHAFDAQKLKKKNGKWHIAVRNSHEGEAITALDGAHYTLPEDTIVITDAVEDTLLGIGGIKGGKQAEVTKDTRDIIIEAAHFDPVAIRKTSKELKLRTDASLRFENRPSSHLTVFALEEVKELIVSIAGGTYKGSTDTYPTPESPIDVSVTVAEINSLLGVTMTEKDVTAILKRLDFTYTNRRDNFTVTAPFERSDLHIKEDLIEEVGRLYGYKKIQSQSLEPLKEKPKVNKSFYYSERVRRALVEMGFSEVYTYTLFDAGEVELANPLSTDKCALRISLERGLKESIKQNEKNAPFLGLDVINIFEIGTVFTVKGEKLQLGVATLPLNGKDKSSQQHETFEMIKRALSGALGNNDISGTEHDGVFLFDFDELIKPLEEKDVYESIPRPQNKVIYKSLSPYPFALRDIAVWTQAGAKEDEVISHIVGEAGDLFANYFLFDKFEKEGKVSYAFHLVFQSRERTLTDDDIGAVMERITKALNKQKGWEVR